MRPRVFPAEDTHELIDARALDPASMRPRVFPAEDMDIAERAGRLRSWLQ